MKRRQFLETSAALSLGMALPVSDLLAQSSIESKTTDWTIKMEGMQATLFRAIGGRSPTEFKLCGVCYSPCPINGSNAEAPNIGDWFWDGFKGEGYAIRGWDNLWKRDLPNLVDLGVNTIRVYSMMSRQFTVKDAPTQDNPNKKIAIFPKATNGKFPADNHLFTHNNFLDMCWKYGIQVLVGIPLPSRMYWKELYDNPAETSPTEKAFWEAMLSETVTQVASHPAVLGFTIQNEIDGDKHTYTTNENLTPQVEFWWSQMEKMAGLAKKAMGQNKKLVGMANHDDPRIPGEAEKYMANCPSIDFWGVNTYQTIDLNAVFNEVPNVGPGYAGLKGAALKPVILTEYGLPATGHGILKDDNNLRKKQSTQGILLAEGELDKDVDDPTKIYHNEVTINNTAAVISKVIPQAFNGRYPLCIGLYYFEYSDELWNQPESLKLKGYGKHNYYGGPKNIGFPNHYWDQHGFGLFSVSRGIYKGKAMENTAPIWVGDASYAGPNTPVDILTKRKGTFDAVQAAFKAAKK